MVQAFSKKMQRGRNRENSISTWKDLALSTKRRVHTLNNQKQFRVTCTTKIQSEGKVLGHEIILESTEENYHSQFRP